MKKKIFKDKSGSEHSNNIQNTREKITSVHKIVLLYFNKITQFCFMSSSVSRKKCNTNKTYCFLFVNKFTM